MTPFEIIALHLNCNCPDRGKNPQEKVEHILNELEKEGYRLVPTVQEIPGSTLSQRYERSKRK